MRSRSPRKTRKTNKRPKNPERFFDSHKKIVPDGDDFFVRRAEGVCWSPSAMEKTDSPPRLVFLIPGKRKMPRPTPLTHLSRTKHQKAPWGLASDE